nr:hypothetical protein [Tanacetum cinerariifolium]
MCEMVCQFIQKKQEEKQIKEDQAANARYWKIPTCCDDDDDHNFAITPNEPIDSLSMGDEHLDTISVTESDEFLKSNFENLVPNLSESEGENECDVPACFTTFSNILFNAEYEFDSSDDQSLSDEDILEKIFSNPLFEEEIISMKIDQHHFNAESDLIESLLNHDSSIILSSSKIDSLLDEFVGELTLLKSIPSGIDETNCHFENEIRLTKRFLYDNSSPRPPEEFVSENSDAEIESFSPSPIFVKDSDSFIEEIDLSFNLDYPMLPGIEEDDDDSERDILILKELLDNYSLSLPVIESYHFDIPSFSRPPAKPPDGNTKILNIKMMGDNSKQKLSAKCPMMTHGKNIPIMDVPLFHFYPLDQLNLLHLAGSQPMLKSSHKTEASVIISIPPLVGGVADVVVEIKGAGLDSSIYVKRSLIMEISTEWLSELEMEELAAGFMNYDLDQLDSFSAEINVENMTFIEKSGKTWQPEIILPSYQEKISSIAKSSATLVPLTAATQTLSNTFTISFGNINLEDEVLKFDDSVGYEAARTISVPTKAARKQMQAKDHVLAERKRRDKLNNQFSSLSALLPNLKKIDKSSVLEDATNYIKELQGRVKDLEEASQIFRRKDVQVSVTSKKRSRLGTSIDDKYYSFNGTTNNIVATSAPCNTYPEIDLRISGSSVIVSIQCQKNIYYLVKVLNQMQKLGLSIISSMSAMPFAKTTHLITIVAQIEEDLSMEAAELVKRLRQAIYLTFDSNMH